MASQEATKATCSSSREIRCSTIFAAIRVSKRWCKRSSRRKSTSLSEEIQDGLVSLRSAFLSFDAREIAERAHVDILDQATLFCGLRIYKQSPLANRLPGCTRVISSLSL